MSISTDKNVIAVGELCLHAQIASRSVHDATLKSEAIHRCLLKTSDEVKTLSETLSKKLKENDAYRQRLQAEVDELDSEANKLRIQLDIANEMLANGRDGLLQEADKVRKTVNSIMAAIPVK